MSGAADSLAHSTAFNFMTGASAMTIMVTIGRIFDTGGATQPVVVCSNFGIVDRLNQFGYVDDAGATFAIAGPALTVGPRYVVGLRGKPGVANLDLFVNGARFTVAATPSAFSATPLSLGNTVAMSQGYKSKFMDVRIWNRFMPDAAFQRYLYNPRAFYTVSRASLKGVSANAFGRMFFPFLHPALQS
jgi:hypothetical protein